MLQKYGASLARSRAVACDVTASHNDVTVVERRAPDGSRFLFVGPRNMSHRARARRRVRRDIGRGPEIIFHYRLEPFGAKILYLPPGATNPGQGEWLPEPAPSIERPTGLPIAGVTSSLAKMRRIPARRIGLDRTWSEPCPSGHLRQPFYLLPDEVSSSAVKQLCWSNIPTEMPFWQLSTANASRVSGTTASCRVCPAGGDGCSAAALRKHGHANGGSAMEQASGISAARLADSALGVGKLFDGWRMRLVNGTSNCPEVRTDFNDAIWTPVAGTRGSHQLTPDQAAVFRASLD